MPSLLLSCLVNDRLRSQFNHFFYLGVNEVGDVVEARYQRILEFVEA